MAISPILTSIQRPEDAINAALKKIGYPIRLDQMKEGSAASVAATYVYGQTRDALLVRLEPGFARRYTNLTMIEVSPVPGYNPVQTFNPAVNPPPMFRYAYTYPIDALAILSLMTAPFLIPNMSPRAAAFSVFDNYTTTPSTKLIATDLAGAIACYVGRETNPQVWDALFCAALIDDLAEALRPVLGTKQDPGAMTEAGRDTDAARHERG
jgi:hypothetical protein